MKPSSILLVTAVMAFSATGLASAQTPAQSPSAPGAKKTRDPNEVVCEKIEVVGSRLSVKKVCMTRSEWAEQKRQDRLDIDKAQVLRPCGTQGC